MQGRFLNVGQVHGNLGHAVFLDIPPDGLHVFQHSRNANRFAVGIEHRFSPRRAVVRLDPSIFPNIKGNGRGSSHRFGVQVNIVGDQEFPGANRLLRPTFH